MPTDPLKRWFEAYGADPRRWPDDDGARHLDPRHADPSLEDARREAGELDAWLSSYAVAPPDAAFEQRLDALWDKRAPVSPAGRRAWFGPGSWMWPGAGLAGIALAGALAGVGLVSLWLPAPPSPDAPLFWPGDTAFGTLSMEASP